MKNRLRVLRAERDWSQAQLAEAVGVSRQTINAIETERYDPSLPLALKIGRLVRQPVESIFFLDSAADLVVKTPYTNPRALERPPLRALLQRAFDVAPPQT